ncbi:exo-beta-N-acetylmuramidase NamZ domain-containing protein [Streptomyces sp. TRM70350]|uniref:exo-beta-N-acetylmuramidase NamZ domain-containing protein n=1 Tax=Streptomyces sp. TRM70350 TaxID=2856165 RepID=UPI0027DFEE7E|nr:exo-beta-N-acetylmuramidase NamZ domain-containing protein [Streptomyces sp. TRM70350]
MSLADRHRMSTDNRVAVTTGIARLHARPGPARPGRVGLVTSHTGVLPDLRPAAPALLEADAPPVARSGPEHGLHGSGQGGENEAAHADPATGPPVGDTYRLSGEHVDSRSSTGVSAPWCAAWGTSGPGSAPARGRRPAPRPSSRARRRVIASRPS